MLGAVLGIKERSFTLFKFLEKWTGWLKTAPFFLCKKKEPCGSFFIYEFAENYFAVSAGASRKALLKIFPTFVFGNSVLNSTSLGTL